VTTTAYAICLDGDAEHADRDAMYAHHEETLRSGGTGSSHRGRVVNPTPEEVEARRIRHIVNSAIEDAMHDAFEDLDRQIRRGTVTEQAITDELSRTDFADAWDEWRAEVSR